MNDTEEIKKLLSDFIEKSLATSNLIGLKDGSEVKLNKSIYEIQYHLNEELEKYKINARLNAQIKSDSIIESFQIAQPNYHKSEHYAFPFLKYLYRNFNVSDDLLTYIDGFIKQIKELLSWQDIVITKTGATRCKTNIRFSLNLLRDMQLVRKRNEKDKRTLLPTVMGQLVVHYFDWINNKQTPLKRPETELSFNGYLYFSGHLRRLAEPMVLVQFLDHIKSSQVFQDDVCSKVEKYLHEFVEIVLKSLKITERGINFNEETKKGDDYKKLLAKLNNDYLFLPSNLE